MQRTGQKATVNGNWFRDGRNGVAEFGGRQPRCFMAISQKQADSIMNKEKLLALARDLRKTPPRSPRETLGGFVIAARMLDKARADLLGINGEYNFYPCGLGAYFWKFTGLDPQKFKEFVGTGATDEQVDDWIRANTTVKEKLSVIRWNNEMTGVRLCDLSEPSQEYLAAYIPKFCKPQSKVKFFFDVYDVEEGVL
jgi:hypothetical protein